MMRRTILRSTVIGVVVSWLCVGGAVSAECVDPGSPALLIVGAQVFDGSGGPVWSGDVLVEGGRIAALGRDLPAPAGVRRVDARGFALLPGLMDVHTHWAAGGVPATLPQIANAYLAHGVTTVFDHHQAPEAYAPLRAWLARIAAPQVYFAARVGVPLGHGADWGDQTMTRWVNSPAAGRAAVDAVMAYRPDFIKVFSDGWRYGVTADNASMSEETLSAVASQAHHHRLLLASHTVTIARGRQAARAGVDLIAHSLLDAPVDRASIVMMRAHGTAYAPTLAVYEPIRHGARGGAPDDTAIARRRRHFQYALDNVGRLHRAGVAIVLGTDAGMPGVPHGQSSLHELALLVQAGLSPADALLAATARAAQVLGLSDRGVIAVGKRADLLLVQGRPWRNIADIRHIRRVWVGGIERHGPDARLPPGNHAVALPAQAIVGALVDDFERADGRTALNTLRYDDADGGNDRTWQTSMAVPRESGGHALSVQARLSHASRRRAAVVLPLSRGAVAPVDLRRFQALQVEIRALGEVTLEYRGLHGRRWRHVLPADRHWRTLVVPFAWMRGAGSASKWRGDDLQQVVFSASGKPGEQVWFEIDEVRFQ